MRFALILAVACLLSACAAQQSSVERAFIQAGDGARTARAELDAEAILRGMEQARSNDERLARALNRNTPYTAPARVTR